MAARAAGRYCAGAVPSLHPARAQRAARPASGGEGEAGSGRWVPSAGLSGRRAGPGRAGQASAVPMRGTAGERSGGGLRLQGGLQLAGLGSLAAARWGSLRCSPARSRVRLFLRQPFVLVPPLSLLPRG